MRHCLTVDLKSDPDLISRYEELHKPSRIPVDIIDGIKAVGIKEMEIYRWDNRMFMIVDTEDDFDWDIQMKKLAELPGQKDWEILMDNYQERLDEGHDKWKLMHAIFSLTSCK